MGKIGVRGGGGVKQKFLTLPPPPPPPIFCSPLSTSPYFWRTLSECLFAFPTWKMEKKRPLGRLKQGNYWLLKQRFLLFHGLEFRAAKTMFVNPYLP